MFWVGETRVAARCRKALEVTLRASPRWQGDPLAARIGECGYQVVVLDRTGSDAAWSAHRSEAVGLLRIVARAWSLGGWIGVKRLVQARPDDLELFDPVEVPSGPEIPLDRILLRLRAPSLANTFVALVADDTRTPIRLTGLVRLVSCWQVENGRLPLHAAGVDMNGQGFAFLGRSGAGKSTAARMSQLAGAKVFDDDQVVVERSDDFGWALRTWPQSDDGRAVPLVACFLLVQSDHDEVRRVLPAKGSALILGQYWELTSPMSTVDASRLAFALASEIARTVPVCELQFTKSPAFWDAIRASGL